MQNSIEILRLSKSFAGLRAVDDLTVPIPRGRTTGLIGPNGSGKTTLMNLITGTLVPDCGEILVGTPCQGVLKSKDASATRPYHAINPLDLRRLRIARTFQDGRLIDQLSVWDNLVLPIAETRVFKALRQIVSTTPPLRGTPSLAKGNLNARVTAVLQKINLTEYANAPVESLSYGQRKLVELGRAIIQDADIYLLDEPFTGLFAKMVDQVLKLIAELKQSGKTIVIIEHNMGLIRAVADHIIVLDHGQVLAHGAPDKVLKDENVQQAYLGV